MLEHRVYSLLVVIILMRKCTGMEDSFLRDKIDFLSTFSFSNGLYPLQIFEESAVMEDIVRQIEKSFIQKSIPVSRGTPNLDYSDNQFFLYIFQSSNTLNLSRIDGLLKVYPNRRCVLLSLEPSDISLPDN
nr:uncharacterized protein LOC121113890 [Lepeophtheirus salmonis]